jgi:heme exporter protein A
VLQAIDLECTRGERLLFRGLSFEAAAGTCLHVAGENGAGKTSLLRILCGLLAPTAGHVQWRGTATRALREAYWAELAYVGHLNGVKDDLTAAENVRFAAAFAGHPTDATHIAESLAALGLAGFEDRPARALSQGQRRRIALTRLFLAAQATLWILDEPFTALDTRGVAVLSQLIVTHLGRGGIVVLTTHQDVAIATDVQRLDLRAAEAGA